MNVSFIIPAYNEESNIKTCIDSIIMEITRWNNFEEPYDKFEIIVVDNGSTDNTAEIAKSFNNVKVVYEPKKGLTHARQKGYMEAKYPFQAYIDADNWLYYGWLNNIYYILDDENVVAISGPQYFPNQTIWFRMGGWIFYGLTMLANKYVGPTIQGGNFILRKSALEYSGGHSTNISFYGEDTDLAVRLSKYGKIVLLRDMWIYSSDRRFKEEGVFKTTWNYIINYLSINFLDRPVTLEYKDIRPDDKTI